ncbi:hypothetical protein GCM10009836_50480 [Pseudonocardia ailaonensis]|uniref:CHK kinase-like domain-containing protein n=1 Tax=Pseudonocardia ailaonensis TaxID=367279 RepID=A0ABN2ND80_9PSEU
MDTLDIPLLERIDEIDARWLEAALGGRVAGFTTRPIGAGNVSDTVLVTVDWAERPDGAPAAVVAKFRPSVPEVHAHGVGSGAYHREIGAYRAITERAACRIPHLHHVDGDETNINLVIEDLTGAEAGNQVAGCDIPHAEAVLRQFARLHATFFPVDLATAPAWPIRMTEVAGYWSEKARAGAVEVRKRFADRLSATDLDLVDGMAEVVHAWHLLPQERLTLTHGDPRVDNILFESVGGRLGAVLIDWQVTGLRNPMYDVGYFLSGSVGIDDRRAHEQAPLEHYVREFEAVAPGYALADAIEDYRTQVLSGLVITTAATAILPDVEPVNTLLLALLERNCAAAADWDSVAVTRERSA